MLHARRGGAFKRTYEITDDTGKQVAVWNPRTWRQAGRVELAGGGYEVETSGWTNRRATLIGADGAVLATADGVGRKRWVVQTPEATYEFERVSAWRADQALLHAGQRVGILRRTGFWGNRAEADLPGLPLPVALFAFAVTLLLWERNDTAAATAAS